MFHLGVPSWAVAKAQGTQQSWRVQPLSPADLRRSRGTLFSDLTRSRPRCLYAAPLDDTLTPNRGSRVYDTGDSLHTAWNSCVFQLGAIRLHVQNNRMHFFMLVMLPHVASTMSKTAPPDFQGQRATPKALRMRLPLGRSSGMKPFKKASVCMNRASTCTCPPLQYFPFCILIPVSPGSYEAPGQVCVALLCR